MQVSTKSGKFYNTNTNNMHQSSNQTIGLEKTEFDEKDAIKLNNREQRMTSQSKMLKYISSAKNSTFYQ